MLIKKCYNKSKFLSRKINATWRNLFFFNNKIPKKGSIWYRKFFTKYLFKPFNTEGNIDSLNKPKTICFKIWKRIHSTTWKMGSMKSKQDKWVIVECPEGCIPINPVYVDTTQCNYCGSSHYQPMQYQQMQFYPHPSQYQPMPQMYNTQYQSIHY